MKKEIRHFKSVLLLAGCCLLAMGVKAQSANHHFALHDSSPDSMYSTQLHASTLTADGGWIVLEGNEYRGTISPTTYGFSLIRYDASGSRLWNTYIYGDANNQNNYRRIVEMPDGGFSIIYNGVFGGNGSIVKTDATGNFLFIKNYSTGILDAQLDTTDGGLLLTTNSGNTFSRIIKTDALGNTVWFDAEEFVPDPDHYYTAKLLSNGNYLAVGVAYSNPSISIGGGLVACYSPAGVLLWSKTYYDPNEWITEFSNFAELSDGTIMIGGATSQLNVNGRWPLMTKIDQNGNVLWSKNYGSGINDFQTTFCFGDDFTYVAGCIWTNASGTFPIVSKIDSAGNMLWARVYPQTNSNNISFGPYMSFGSGTYSSVGEPSVKGNHFYMYNYSDYCSSDTSLLQSCYLSDTSFTRTNVNLTVVNMTPSAATAAPTPTSDTRTNSFNINFVKYDACVPAGIENPIGHANVSVTVFPNPFNGITHFSIHSNLPIHNGELRIVDVLGNEVKRMMVNSNEVILDREGLSNGIYFYQLIDGGEVMAMDKIIITE